jgi:hypothetical protein
LHATRRLNAAIESRDAFACSSIAIAAGMHATLATMVSVPVGLRFCRNQMRDDGHCDAGH